MRSRRKERTTFLSLLGASVAAALFLPALPRVQSVAGAAFAPVSHPAKAVGGAVIDLVSSDVVASGDGVDLDELDAPALRKRLTQLDRDIDAMRTVLLAQTEQLEVLKRVNADRAKLGGNLRQRCEPLTITGVIENESDLLQSVGGGEATTDGRIALHTGGTDGGFAGTVEAGLLGAARVRLVTDRNHRPVGGALRRFDETTKEVVEVPLEPFLVNGLGEGRCVISRHKMDDLTDNNVVEGDWIIVRDDDLPELVFGRRIGRVEAIEPIVDEPGFARVIIKPDADLTRARELMVLTRP